jgi:hypothetical protein
LRIRTTPVSMFTCTLYLYTTIYMIKFVSYKRQVNHWFTQGNLLYITSTINCIPWHNLKIDGNGVKLPLSMHCQYRLRFVFMFCLVLSVVPSSCTGDVSRFWLSCLCPYLLHCSQISLNYFTFKSFDFEPTWWWLFQKRAVRTKFDIYVFIIVFGLTQMGPEPTIYHTWGATLTDIINWS